MLTHLSPVQYWFVKTQVNQFVHKCDGLMPSSLKWNELEGMEEHCKLLVKEIMK